MNWKKIFLYITFACLFSWAIALVMYLDGTDLTSIKGMILLAGLYMPGPAIATLVIQKVIYKEGIKKYGWSFDRKALKWVLFTPLAFLAITLLTFGIIGLFGNTDIVSQFGALDFNQQNLQERLREVASAQMDVESMTIPEINAVLLFFLMLIQGIIAGSTINLPFMFGEELGWRGLMHHETLKMGFLKSSLFIGVVWGIWHFPVILMGHNYPSFPYAGVVMMCLFTISLSPLFSYIRMKTKSILGPCMLHGMINATGAMYALYVANPHELFSSIAGWAGIIAGAVVTICILVFDKDFVKYYRLQGVESTVTE